jgi:beta-glucosidase
MKIKLEFPEGFYWGAASASYQVEGGIENCDWAAASRAENSKVPPAGQSSDHYNRYEEDFDLAKSLGHNSTRISIEWARIEPEEGKFDPAEIEHYRDVLRAIRDRGMTPFVTFWHFTLPTWLSEKGGITNAEFPKYFERYCEYVADGLHKHCDFWSTINEPNVVASNGFLRGNWPPFKKNPFANYRAVKNLIRAHNLAYKKVKSKYPKLEVGIVKDNMQYDSDWKPWNKLGAKFVDWWWNHYLLKRVVKNCDSIGLNFYFYFHFGSRKKAFKKFDRDGEFQKNDMGWDLVPEALYNVLMDLRRYNKSIYITEAGLADKEDKYRADYIRGLVMSTHQAIQDGLNIRGFMYWSLMDNFEWAEGYNEHFGLIKFDADTQKRTVRESAYVYKKICEENALIIE